MAFACLLPKISASQCILRGQTLRAAKNLIPRSSATFSNNDLHQLFKKQKTNLLQPQMKLTLSPVSFATSSALAKENSDAHKSHNHVTIWQLERLLSVGLLGIIPGALLMPCQALDVAASIAIVMHTHWGLEAIVVDYIRPIIFGNMAPKIGLGLLYAFSMVMLAGLLNLTFNDAGLANSILHILKL